MPFLWVVAQGQKLEEGRRVELARDPFSIGRGSDNDLTIEDEQISRNHAKILRTARGWVLTDNESANGIWVDDKRVENVRLKDGVRVRLGGATLTYHDLRDKETVVAGGAGKAAGISAPAAGAEAARRPAPSAPRIAEAPTPVPVLPPSPVAAMPQTPSAPHLPAMPQTPSAPHPPAIPQTPSTPHLPAVPFAPAASPWAPPAVGVPGGRPPKAREPAAGRPRTSNGVVVAIVVASLVIVGSGVALIWRLSANGGSEAAAPSATAQAEPRAAELPAVASAPRPPAAGMTVARPPRTDPAVGVPNTPSAASGEEFSPDAALGFGGPAEGRRQRIDAAKGGRIALANGARVDVPAGALDRALDLHLIRAAAPAGVPGLARAIVGDAYFVASDRPGRRKGPITLALPYDPSALPTGVRETGLGAVAVYDGRFAWPVAARVDTENRVVVVERPELGVLDPSAGAGLARRPEGEAPGPPAAPPRLGHLVVATDLLGQETHAVGPCDRALPGEVHSIAGHAFRILVAVETTCTFVETVSGILQEALAAYQREFPLADGSPPFDEGSASTVHPMPVVLDMMTADFPGAVYNPLGWGGSMTVDAVTGVVPEAERPAYDRELRVTLFHELFHGVQDMQRNMFAAYWGGRMWWYEATAEWAGRRFSLGEADGKAAFDDMVDAAMRPGHGTPYVLAVPIDESRSWHGGRASYHYAMLVEHVEGVSPGSVRRTLQEDVTGSDELLARLYADGRIAETYTDFLARFWERGGGGVWTAFRLMETGLETREWRPADAEPGTDPGAPVALRGKEARYPDDGRTIAMALAPATARFFWIRAAAPVNPNLALTVLVKGAGQPVAHGLLIRPAAEGPPDVQRLEPDWVRLPGFGSDFEELWIVVFRPPVAGEDRAARPYELRLGLRPDCGIVPPACIGPRCRPTPEQTRWEECRKENERWLDADANAGGDGPP